MDSLTPLSPSPEESYHQASTTPLSSAPEESISTSSSDNVMSTGSWEQGTFCPAPLEMWAKKNKNPPSLPKEQACRQGPLFKRRGGDTAWNTGKVLADYHNLCEPALIHGQTDAFFKISEGLKIKEWTERPFAKIRNQPHLGTVLMQNIAPSVN